MAAVTEASTHALAVPTDAPLVSGPPQGQWTYDHWEGLGDDGARYEVIDGVLYMTTAPSSYHQWIIKQLVRYIGIPAEDQGLALSAFAPIGLLMPGCDPVQPDFLIVRAANTAIFHDRRIRGVPDLLVEVLSPGNADYDRQIKLRAYAAAGVPEYVIVDARTRSLIVYRLAEPGSYAAPEQFGEDAVVCFTCLPEIYLPVGALFTGAPDTTL